MSIKGIFLSGFLGDAIGTVVEREDRLELQQNPVTGLRGWGTYNVPSGTWSDDSSMTWCTIESILEGYDVHNLALKFVDWYRNAKYTATNLVFDIGISTSKALDSIDFINISSPEKLRDMLLEGKLGCFGINDSGNGSLMRSAALIVLLHPLDLIERFHLIKQNSSITHAHIRPVLACFLFCELLLEMLETKDKDKAYRNATDSFTRLFKIKELGIPESELEVFSRIVSGEIRYVDEDYVFSDGYVIHTLEAVIWSFYQSDSFTETMFKSVNLGNDTDTVCSISCQLAASYYPLEQIPEELLQGVKRIDEIRVLAEQLEQYYVNMRLSNKPIDDIKQKNSNS